ncbi:MAG: hypothetical protein HY397_01865 [Candidatus Doudnabacteria bacterium]|nr:hypothetical protein [Candidatus Doudnabacteria bacterium]
MNDDRTDKLALIAQMIDSAENSIQSAKHLLRELLGARADAGPGLAEKAKALNVLSGGKVIEGVFDGQNMIGPDNKQYPVPANYASKSKLVEGDVLKLTIADDGSFIYKQIGPVERKKILGILSQDENGQYRVVGEGKSYKVLLASLTYFKAEPGDEVTIVIPKEGSVTWAAVENVIKRSQGAAAGETSAPVLSRSGDEDEDLDIKE